MPATVLEPKVSLSNGVCLATIARITNDGVPWLHSPHGKTVAAHVMSGLTREALESALSSSSPVVVACLAESPAIIGIMASSVSPASATAETAKKNRVHRGQGKLPPKEEVVVEQRLSEVRVDGARVFLTGQEEVTLRCGKASITLTKAGKIIIRGAYVLTRSSGVNRIKGGSVQIN